MGDITINQKNVITQSGTAEPVLASNVSLASATFPSGHVVQIVNVQNVTSQTNTTAIPFDDTIPQKTEGHEKMTLAITPKSSSNKLLFNVVVHAASAASSQYITCALFQDTTANAIAVASTHTSTGDQRIISLPLIYYMTAGTASATTFKIRVGASDTGATTFNGVSTNRQLGGVLTSSMTITEIQGS